MKLLIDSHVLIWLLYEPEKLTGKSRQLLQSADVVYISAASLWELTLKFTKKKLAYSPQELAKGVKALNLERLPIRDQHLHHLPGIRLDHADPFDTLLIAQSEAEGCKLLTADAYLLRSKYAVVNATK